MPPTLVFYVESYYGSFGLWQMEQWRRWRRDAITHFPNTCVCSNAVTLNRKGVEERCDDTFPQYPQDFLVLDKDRVVLSMICHGDKNKCCNCCFFM